MAEDVLRMATSGGARAIGRQALLGSIEPGRLADIVIHSPTRPELHPPTNTVRNLVYAARSKSVRTVIVNGQVVLDDGRFPHLEEPTLLADIDAASKRLLQRMGFTVPPNRVPSRVPLVGT
jgi:5-methylthioadenosine/S-adenosylhomocysteine deaminase